MLDGICILFCVHVALDVCMYLLQVSQGVQVDVL